MKAAWEEELRDPLLSFVLRAGEEQRLWDPLFLKLCFLYSGKWWELSISKGNLFMGLINF